MPQVPQDQVRNQDQGGPASGVSKNTPAGTPNPLADGKPGEGEGTKTQGFPFPCRLTTGKHYPPGK